MICVLLACGPSFKFGRAVRIRKAEMVQRINELEVNPELSAQLTEKYSAYWKSKAEKMESLV
jgi:hypothetical protein